MRLRQRQDFAPSRVRHFCKICSLLYNYRGNPGRGILGLLLRITYRVPQDTVGAVFGVQVVVVDGG